MIELPSNILEIPKWFEDKNLEKKLREKTFEILQTQKYMKPRNLALILRNKFDLVISNKKAGQLLKRLATNNYCFKCNNSTYQSKIFQS